MNKAKFYNALRKKINLTQQNVFGFEKLLTYAIIHKVKGQKLKYILATAWWETGGKMTPVIEANWLSDTWRRKHLRYYPWYGRGLVQTTWDYNYKKVDERFGFEGKLMKQPDLLLEWEYALPALFLGMEEGWYTGKSIDEYIDDIDESDEEDRREMKMARKVVNGTDKATQIANLGLVFEAALKAGNYK